MAPLSDRQRKAETLARELKDLGAMVVSPLPLAADAKLKFQVLTDGEMETLRLLREAGWDPTLISIYPRVTPHGMQPAGLYELSIPLDRQPVVDNRIRGEIAGKEDAEVAAMLRSWGVR
jgi:hypothetical protein